MQPFRRPTWSGQHWATTRNQFVSCARDNKLDRNRSSEALTPDPVMCTLVSSKTSDGLQTRLRRMQRRNKRPTPALPWGRPARRGVRVGTAGARRRRARLEGNGVYIAMNLILAARGRAAAAGGAMFKTFARFLMPPDMPSPLLWGDEGYRARALRRWSLGSQANPRPLPARLPVRTVVAADRQPWTRLTGERADQGFADRALPPRDRRSRFSRRRGRGFVRSQSASHRSRVRTRRCARAEFRSCHTRVVSHSRFPGRS